MKPVKGNAISYMLTFSYYWNVIKRIRTLKKILILLSWDSVLHAVDW